MVDADQVMTRSDTVSNVVLAEIYHYQHERVVDFRDLFKSLLSAKIQFYKEVSVLSLCVPCVCVCVCVCVFVDPLHVISVLTGLVCACVVMHVSARVCLSEELWR